MLAPALKRLDVRPAREADLAAALALLEFEAQKTPWLGRTAELLRESVASPRGEYRACVAERDAEIVGLGVYGMVAGTRGTGLLYSVLVAPRSRRAGIGQRIMAHITADLKQWGARLIIAEIPGDPSVMRYRALLISFGFMEETRIDDYYRDGVSQIISRYEL